MGSGGIQVPRDEIEIRFSRASGPGGQNVNKRDTRVEPRFDIAASRALNDSQKRRALGRLAGRLDARGRLRVVAAAGRTQAENRRRALQRLMVLLEEAVRPPPRPRVRTAPTLGARARRRVEKTERSRTKRLRRRPGDED
jgi:ribosome-associated protein